MMHTSTKGKKLGWRTPQVVDEFMEVLSPDAALLSQDVTLCDGFDHAEHHGVADELHLGSLRRRLVWHVDQGLGRAGGHRGWLSGGGGVASVLDLVLTRRQ